MKREYLKNIKSENRIDRIRLIMPNDPVIGGQPSDNVDDFTSNTPFLDIASTMKFAIDSINKTESNANNRLEKNKNLSDLQNKTTARSNLGLGTSATMNTTSTLSDRTDQVAVPKMVNDVNRTASTAQKTANTANEKAVSALNEANKKRNLNDFTFESTYAALFLRSNSVPGLGKEVLISVSSSGNLSFIRRKEFGEIEDQVITSLPLNASGVFYTTGNTTSDKNGFLRSSGTDDAIIKTDIATKSKAGITRLDSSLSDAEDRAATPKIVNDINRAVSTAQKTANTANEKAVSALNEANKKRNLNDFTFESTYAALLLRSNSVPGLGKEVLISVSSSGNLSFIRRKEFGEIEDQVITSLPLNASGVFYTTGNTTSDKNGFLRSSGTDDAITTSDLTSSLGQSVALAATQKLVSDVSSQATAALTKADSAYSLVSKKGEKNTASKASSGWHKCEDTGVIFQWGETTTNDNAISVSFPISFPSRCVCVQTTTWTQDTTIDRYAVLTSKPEKSSFTVKINSDRRTSILWFAIGY